MSIEENQEQERFARILHPRSSERLANARSLNTRFVHYTNADVAMSILRSKEVWMRKSSCMNDFLEVQYGLERLSRAYNGTGSGKNFKNVLNRLFDGIVTEIEKLFNGWLPHFQVNTYLTCVSEHDDGEDTFGRLSMWRAYGDATGIALVLNNSVFLTPADGFGAYSSPVSYLDDQDFEIEFQKIADNCEAERDFIRAHARSEVVSRVFNMLRFATLCTKHPGFAEEREWRVIYCPTLEQSPYLIKSIETIRGIPQPIFKIPLKDIPEIGFFGAMAKLVNRIIIGPSEYPLALREAFVELLQEAGIEDAASKVWTSDIPIRR